VLDPLSVNGMKAIIVFLILMAVCGCQTTGPQFDAKRDTQLKLARVTDLKSVSTPNKIDPSLYRSSEDVFTLGPGDRIEIETSGDPNSRVTTTVGPDGKIYYNLLPGLDVWGLTLAQTKSLLEKELSKYIKSKPQVAINLRNVESKKVWILGRVNTPGVFPLSTPTTLLDAISQAGGPLTNNTIDPLDDMVDYQHSFIMREGKVLPVNFQKLLRDGDINQNIYLKPDDFVYLPTATSRNVYVLGAVAQPRMIRFSNQMSLVTAMAGAGGTIKYANLSQVAIVRGSLTDPKIAIMDYGDIVRGKTSDVLLEPSDLVYVPFSPYQKLERYVDLILNTFARTVGANEGARWVDPDAGSVGASVGITTTTSGPTATVISAPP
jgi:polysaccharide biosynthesis/export protein